ncbi:hypothetical protein BCR44DRAFT_49409 [Catenaria anguillulae PL171]|uniref:Uncharacterized protein n=1 Tax=Catenaria anguillulae PL171 TaxID=765915 RepID=A0A1Y2HMY2_9FUNG|nr:hypothetical protein BCR44DRAFT_49409 [Catenaria anguillulae PL171]
MSSPAPVLTRDLLPLSPPRSPEPFPPGPPASSYSLQRHRDSAADTIVSCSPVASDHRRVSLSAPVSPTNLSFSSSPSLAHQPHGGETLATSTPIPVLVSRPCSATPSAKFAKHAVYRWAVAVRTPRHAVLHLSKSPALCLPGLAAQSLTLPPTCAIVVVENDRDLCGPIPDLSAALVLESPHASFLWELRSDASNVDSPVVEPTKQILADWPLAKVVAMAATPDTPLVFSPPPVMAEDHFDSTGVKRTKSGKKDKRMSTTAGGRRRSSSASVATMVDQGPIIVRALRAQDAHSMAEVLSGRRTPASVSPPPPFPVAHLPASPQLVGRDQVAAGAGAGSASPLMSPAQPLSPITPTIPRRGPESIIGAAAHYQRAVSPAFPSPPFSPRMGTFGGSPVMPSTHRPSGESTMSGSSGSVSSVPNSPTIPHNYLDHPSRGRRPSTHYPTPTPGSPSLRRRSLSVAAHRHLPRPPSFSASTDPSPPLIPSHDAVHLLMASPPLTPPMSNTHSPAVPDTPAHAHAHAQEDLVGELRRLHLALGSIQSNQMRAMARRRPSDSGSTVGLGAGAGLRDHAVVPPPPPRSRSVGPAVNQREAARALMSHFHGSQVAPAQ